MISICDVHSHILPGVDDGCADLAQTLQVLQTAHEQGVRDLIATPHFYKDKETADSFLQRRKAAYEELEPHIPPDMRICLGAEVAYFNGISQYHGLEQLCFGKSRYLLLELPFTPWDSNLHREIQNLVCIRGIIPVLAHIERYISLQSGRAIERIMESDALAQMNAEHLLRLFGGFRGRRMIKRGMVQLLGSDCHNNDTRPFNLGKAMDSLIKYNMNTQIRDLTDLSQEIFQTACFGGDAH